MRSQLLKAAKEVVDSLNKNLIFVAPLDARKTEQLEEHFASLLHPLESDLGLKNMTMQSLQGQSGSKTEGYFKDQQLIYVMKKSSYRELARELVSKQDLRDLHLKESEVTDTVLVGKMGTEAVSLQAAAKGKALPELLNSRIIKNGLWQAAKGFSELHLKGQSLAKPLPKEVQDFNYTLFYLIIQRIKEDLKQENRMGMGEEQLNSILKKISCGVVNQWGSSSYSHGDCGLEHLFFDGETHRLTLIDTSSFVVSVDRHHHPIGFAPYDFSWVWCSLINEGFRQGLSTEKVQDFETYFRTSYEQLMGAALSPLPARQLADMTKLFYFIRKANRELKSKEDPHLQNLIDYCICQIKKML